MIITVTSDAEEQSVRNALAVINTFRRRPTTRTLATRPIVEDTPWVRTVWPHAEYL